ncbi:hypothetical protein [Aeromonas caviae]|uniref:hypothetical protein n=1 Tax=Aeromonas caviae TaxID=648 RepID=UPI002B45ECD2|nr:hypothetical protein [Aeromonas caviae]
MSKFKEQLDSLLNLSQDICNALDEDNIVLATEFDRERQAVIEFLLSNPEVKSEFNKDVVNESINLNKKAISIAVKKRDVVASELSDLISTNKAIKHYSDNKG